MTKTRRPRIPKRITLDWLRRHCACDTSDFERIFGKSAELTRRNLAKYNRESGYHETYWLAEKFFGEEVADDFSEKAQKSYDRVYSRLFWQRVDEARKEQDQ